MLATAFAHRLNPRAFAQNFSVASDALLHCSETSGLSGRRALSWKNTDQKLFLLPKLLKYGGGTSSSQCHRQYRQIRSTSRWAEFQIAGLAFLPVSFQRMCRATIKAFETVLGCGWSQSALPLLQGRMLPHPQPETFRPKLVALCAYLD